MSNKNFSKETTCAAQLRNTNFNNLSEGKPLQNFHLALSWLAILALAKLLLTLSVTTIQLNAQNNNIYTSIQ